MVVASGESQSVLWQAHALKNPKQAVREGGGAVTRREIQVGERESEKDGGKETEGESRCRKSSPSSACHLLLYALSSSAEVIGFLLPPFLCLRAHCNPEENERWADRGNQNKTAKKKEKVEPFLIDSFSPVPFVICRGGLLLFLCLLFLKVRDRKKKNTPAQSIPRTSSLYTRNKLLFPPIVDFLPCLSGLFSLLSINTGLLQIPPECPHTH